MTQSVRHGRSRVVEVVGIAIGGRNKPQIMADGGSIPVRDNQGVLEAYVGDLNMRVTPLPNVPVGLYSHFEVSWDSEGNFGSLTPLAPEAKMQVERVGQLAVIEFPGHKGKWAALDHSGQGGSATEVASSAEVVVMEILGDVEFSLHSASRKLDIAVTKGKFSIR